MYSPNTRDSRGGRAGSPPGSPGSPNLSAMVSKEYYSAVSASINSENSYRQTATPSPTSSMYDSIMDSMPNVLHGQLHDAIRKFDDHMTLTYRQSTNGAWQAEAPSPTEDVLRAFLQQTKDGRGLKIIRDVMKDAPRSAQIQHLGTVVFLYTLMLLQERIALIQKYDEERHSKANQRLRSGVKKATTTIHAHHRKPVPEPVQFRSSLSSSPPPVFTPLSSSPASLSPQSPQSSPKNSGPPKTKIKGKGGNLRKSSMFGVLLTLKEDVYGTNNHNKLRMQEAIEGPSPEPEHTYHPLWLPDVSDPLVEEEMLPLHKPPRKDSGTPESWAEEIVNIGAVQNLLAAMNNVEDVAVQVPVMKALRILVEMCAQSKSAVHQLLSPMKDFVFVDGTRDPIHTTPSARKRSLRHQPSDASGPSAASVSDETVSHSRSGKENLPCGISVLLRVMKMHANKFIIQGSAAQLIVTACKYGGEDAVYHIVSCKAYDHQHGIPVQMLKSSLRSNKLLGSMHHVHAEASRYSDSRTRGRSSSPVPMITPAKASTPKRFPAKPTVSLDEVDSRKAAMDFLQKEFKHTNNCVRLLIRVLRRWNLGGERSNKAHSTEFLMSHLTPQAQEQLRETHRYVTIALLQLKAGDERLALFFDDHPNAERTLASACLPYPSDQEIQGLVQQLDCAKEQRLKQKRLAEEVAAAKALEQQPRPTTSEAPAAPHRREVVTSNSSAARTPVGGLRPKSAPLRSTYMQRSRPGSSGVVARLLTSETALMPERFFHQGAREHGPQNHRGYPVCPDMPGIVCPSSAARNSKQAIFKPERFVQPPPKQHLNDPRESHHNPELYVFNRRYEGPELVTAEHMDFSYERPPERIGLTTSFASSIFATSN